jgi:nucleoside-diphosphate-sugar epimerase
MASLLIIGGSGFFGKSILDSYNRGLLSPWGIDLIYVFARNADRLNAEAPELLGSSIKLVSGDIATCKEIPIADYVIHAAASTDAANYLSQPEVEKKNIQAGTYNYCDLAKKFHQNSRIVYCSSGAVYGQQPPDLDRIPEDYDGGPLGEMSLTKQDYAAAKRDAEEAIINLGKQGLSVSIARCFAFVGPYLPRDKHFAIGNFIGDGLNNRPIQVKADHLVYRSYMYADDLVEWLLRIAHSSTSDCPVFNVGSDEAIKIDKLAKIIAEIFYVGALINRINNDEVDVYIPSIFKAQEQLNLTCKYSLNEAIKETIKRVIDEKIN